MKKYLYFLSIFILGTFPQIAKAQVIYTFPISITSAPNSITSAVRSQFFPVCRSNNPDFTCQGEIGLININGNDRSSLETYLMSCSLGSLEHQRSATFGEDSISVRFFNARCFTPLDRFRVETRSFNTESEAIQDCNEKGEESCAFIWKDNNSGKYLTGGFEDGAGWGAVITDAVISGFSSQGSPGGMSGSGSSYGSDGRY